MTPDSPSGQPGSSGNPSGVSSRSGPIHSFDDDQEGLERFLGGNAQGTDSNSNANANTNPIPVVVRSSKSPDFQASGHLISHSVEGNQLLGTVEWDADLESLIGDYEPEARCEFDSTGQLVRVIVELDEDADEEDVDVDVDVDVNEVEVIADEVEVDEVNPNVSNNVDDQIMADGTRDGQRRPSLSPEEAEMATDNDNQIDESTTQTVPQTAEEIKAELERTRKALEKANRSDKERRLRLDELERAEEERKNSSLDETQKINKAKAETERRLAEAERLASDRARQLEELQLERQVEAEARKQDFENPELAYRLIDRKQIEHDVDLDRWEGIPKAIELLKRAYPNLARQKRPGSSPPRDEFPGNQGNRRNGRNAAASNQEDSSSDPFATYAAQKINYERM